MLRKFSAVCMIVVFAFMIGCTTNIHNIGSGAAGADKAVQRQWYILWGLVPLNDVDSNAMAAGATNYTIKTQQSFLDVVINIFTGIITVNSRTVTVTK